MARSAAIPQSSQPIKVDLSYGVMAWPLALLGIPLYLYLPTYLFENWQVSLGIIGVVLMLTRLLDVITDPLVGYWSDRFVEKISRFKQIVLGTLLLIFGVLGLFVPYENALTSYPVMYLFSFGFLAFLGWTLVSVPYQAMVAEITDNTHLKTRLTTVREGFVVFGAVMALVMPFLLDQSPTSPALFQWLWWGLVLSALFGLTLMKNLVVPHLVLTTGHQQPALWLWQTLWNQHRWSLKLMPAYFLNNLANAFPATLFLLFVGKALQLDSDASLFLMIYFVSGVMALPFWFWLSKRIGKHQAWQLSILLALFGFAGVFAVDIGDFYSYLLICFVTGLSLGADIALPASIQADIAQKLSRQLQNVNGLLFGLWGLLTKLSLALAVGIALPLLDFLGIEQQAPVAVETLWLLYAALPIMLKLMALVLLKKTF